MRAIGLREAGMGLLADIASKVSSVRGTFGPELAKINKAASPPYYSC